MKSIYKHLSKSTTRCSLLFVIFAMVSLGSLGNAQTTTTRTTSTSSPRISYLININMAQQGLTEAELTRMVTEHQGSIIGTMKSPTGELASAMLSFPSEQAENSFYIANSPADPQPMVCGGIPTGDGTCIKICTGFNQNGLFLKARLDGFYVGGECK